MTLLAPSPSATRASLDVTDVSSDADYRDWCALHDAIHPHPTTTCPDEMARRDANLDSEHFLRRVLVRDGDTPVAIGIARHLIWLNHPQRLWLWVGVASSARRNGIGRRLFAELEQSVAEYEPREILTSAIEGDGTSCAFLRRRGFDVRERFACSELTLADVDPDLRDSALRRVAEQGIEIWTLPELRERAPERWEHRLWVLTNAIERILPSVHEITPPPIEVFRETILESPLFCEDATVIAVSPEGELVGLSSVWKVAGDPTRRATGLTGVLPAWQRRGIATAMKVTVNDLCIEDGIEAITTENKDTNPMLSINRRLGYRPLPTTLSFVRGNLDG